MRRLEEFRKGELPSASKLNMMVNEIRRLQNVQSGEGIKIEHTSIGLIISRIRTPLTIDDKYKLDEKYNQSDKVRRLGDLKEGDIGDGWRIRATTETDPKDTTDVLYKIMWLINRSFGGAGLTEGGHITDAGGEGLSKEEKYDPHEVPTPVNRTGQIGDVLILTDDDLIAITKDGDKFVLVNIRHDTHHHYNAAHDGRIYFTLTPVGSEPNGLPIVGEMVGDHTKANADTQLGHESVEWRPQFVQPGAEFIITGEIYPSPDIINYSFPPVVIVPNSTIQAYEFGQIGKNEGWSAHYQLQNVIDPYGVGFLIKYSAANPTGGQQDAYMELDFKVINDGGDMSTAVVASAPFTLPVPAGSVEQTLRYAQVGFAWNALLSDKCLVIASIFARDAVHIADTLASRLLAVEVEPMLMTVLAPP